MPSMQEYYLANMKPRHNYHDLGDAVGGLIGGIADYRMKSRQMEEDKLDRALKRRLLSSQADLAEAQTRNASTRMGLETDAMESAFGKPTSSIPTVGATNSATGKPFTLTDRVSALGLQERGDSSGKDLAGVLEGIANKPGLGATQEDKDLYFKMLEDSQDMGLWREHDLAEKKLKEPTKPDPEKVRTYLTMAKMNSALDTGNIAGLDELLDPDVQAQQRELGRLKRANEISEAKQVAAKGLLEDASPEIENWKGFFNPGDNAEVLTAVNEAASRAPEAGLSEQDVRRLLKRDVRKRLQGYGSLMSFDPTDQLERNELLRRLDESPAVPATDLLYRGY